MIAQKDDNIKKAYNVLDIISQDEVARMAYEARQAEIMDQRTREKSAREEGIEKGIQQGIQQGIQGVAQKMLIKGKSIEEIAEVTELSIEEIEKLKKEL